MRKYVVTNINGKMLGIRPYTLTKVLTTAGNLTMWATDEPDVIITTNDTFTKGERVQGKEVYTERFDCIGFEELTNK